MQGRQLGKDKIQLLTQALNAASASINLAKQLMSEIERGGGVGEAPGLVGRYDGMFMITEAGKKYPVPDNYSAKTKLVYNDKLKMIEGPEGRRFKLLEEKPRVEQEARLVVKDGRFEALGKDESFRLLQSAVRWWGGAEGDKVKILLPSDEKHVPFAALVEIVGKKPGAGEPEVSPAKVFTPQPVVSPVPKPPAPADQVEPRPGRVETEKPAGKKEPEKKEPPVPRPEPERPVRKAPPREEKASEAKSAEAKGKDGKEEPEKKASAVKPDKPLKEEEELR